MNSASPGSPLLPHATKTVLRLYHYWRSSSSWRVRWALHYKGVEDFETHAVDLLNGESESPEHLARHPLGYVPVLEVRKTMRASKGLSDMQPLVEGSEWLIESMAMMEWIEETYPSPDYPALLPRDPWLRAQARSLAELINADTQPLQNLTPQFLHSDDPEKRKAWAQHFIRHGLGAYELLCQKTAGKFSVGDSLSLADLCLIPQCYNAERYSVGVSQFPVIQRIWENCKALPSYVKAHPDAYQPKQ